MKNLVKYFSICTLLAGGWVSVFGMLISTSGKNEGPGLAVSGAIIFGASLIALAVISRSDR